MTDDDLLKALDNYFKQDRKFIDTSRIPLICQDIRGMHNALDEINIKLDNKFVTTEAFDPVKKLVYGGVAVTLITILGWVLLSIHR